MAYHHIVARVLHRGVNKIGEMSLKAPKVVDLEYYSFMAKKLNGRDFDLGSREDVEVVQHKLIEVNDKDYFKRKEVQYHNAMPVYPQKKQR